PLQWSGVPPAAKALALVMDDPDAPDPSFTHGLIYGLPPTTKELPEGILRTDGGGLPAGAVQGQNSFRTTGYGGPSPPPGRPHHYRFKVAALDRAIELKPGVTRREVLDAMSGHILAEGELIGTYGR